MWWELHEKYEKDLDKHAPVSDDEEEEPMKKKKKSKFCCLIIILYRKKQKIKQCEGRFMTRF